MTTWTELPSDEVHSFYRVPLEIAMGNGNRFFGRERHPRDLDGPWPLIAFLQNRHQPDVLTLHIHTIQPEALYYQSFNPLTDTGGSLSQLEQQDLIDIANLINKQAIMLSYVTRYGRSEFRQIEMSEVIIFHLQPELFPHSKEKYYVQTEDSLNRPDKEHIITLLIFSTDLNIHISRLYFQIAQFPAAALQDPAFDPTEDAIARINLNQRGLLELASLLGSILNILG